MNMKRFTARNPREALALVRTTFGPDAVVLSTRPCPEGVEVLAMAPESVQQIEQAGQQAQHVAAPLPQPVAAGRAAPQASAAPASTLPTAASSASGARVERVLDDQSTVQDDVAQLQMSTLSFQDYVRERMLKRREQELAAQRRGAAQSRESRPSSAAASAGNAPAAGAAKAEATNSRPLGIKAAVQAMAAQTASGESAIVWPGASAGAVQAERAPVATAGFAADLGAAPALRVAQPPSPEWLSELREVKGLIESRFGALAFMEKLQRDPRQAQLTQRLLDAGFSPALARKLVPSLPAQAEENAWAVQVLERNLMAADEGAALEERGGVFALTGPTGVGKTTSTAKLAAAFAARHGAAQLGLITLDAYRVGAQEQLRTYGRILGVPVHTAHDRASLEDLLDLLSAKRLVLIDTAGMAQRDARTRELLDMLSHRSIQRLVVVNAAAQGETIEDVLLSYRSATAAGVVLSKIDEAVKLGPALDAVIRHRLRVLAVANGQRVPEDWHRPDAAALVQRAFKASAASAWRLDADEVSLLFSGGTASGAGCVGTSPGQSTGLAHGASA
jgi:flagellar biosynthesis protein FlhF